MIYNVDLKRCYLQTVLIKYFWNLRKKVYYIDEIYEITKNHVNEEVVSSA